MTIILGDYVAVWNEPNADERRKRIRSLWAVDGTTCYRLLDAHGYDAIEERVRSSWNKWMPDGKYTFRSKRMISHHNAAMFDFAMVALPGGGMEMNGLSFILLNPDGRIRHDYQFNPSPNDATEFVERYIAVLNEPNEEARRSKIADLWAPDGEFVSESLVIKGHRAIEVEAAKVYDCCVLEGFAFSSASLSQAHHNVVRIKWELRTKDVGTVAAIGSDLLILDDSGRIRSDYRFDEPVD